MSKLFYPDFFNGVFSPMMQSGPSRCFAGSCRVGHVARAALRSAPVRARILFNPSDYHMKNVGNMIDDRGYLGGLQGFAMGDVRMFNAHDLARKAGISYQFGEIGADNPWPSSVTLRLAGRDGDTATLVARSISGGMIETYQIHGFPFNWQGDTYAVLIWNADAGTLSAAAKNVADDLPGFVQRTESRDASGRFAVLLEFSDMPSRANLTANFPKPMRWRLLPALLPVVTTKSRRPQLFRSIEEWRQLASARGISFVQAAIEYEKAFSGWSESDVRAYFEKINDILHSQIHSQKASRDITHDRQNPSLCGRLWSSWLKTERTHVDSETRHGVTRAMVTTANPAADNVLAPLGMCGSSLYSVLDAVAQAKGCSHEKIIESLIVAAGIGAIALTRLHVDRESDCPGESGVCCAMTSAAVTWLKGGDSAQVEHAASMALQANLGIPCGPIIGGKRFPCIARTTHAAATAPLYADLALNGIDPQMPFQQALNSLNSNEEKSKKGVASKFHGGCRSCRQR